MPLRDHFRSPLDDVHSWDELHGMWPAMIVRQLIQVLPEPYFAAPGVYLGNSYEVDIATFRAEVREPAGLEVASKDVAGATWAPDPPRLTVQPQLPNQDVYEVRVYDNRRDRRLVAVIEIVSPSNKDRPQTRNTFVSKIAELLKHEICVSLVDVVGTSDFNLYAESLQFLGSRDPDLGDAPQPIYAATLRMRHEDTRRLLDTWYHPLAIGQPLPTLPVWLTPNHAVPLALESSYEETCRTLRIR